MKKKGFTLIELLAVIVILAVIAIIAVPTILNVVDKAKKGAVQDSGYSISSAAELYYMQNYQNKDDFTGQVLDVKKLKFKGHIDSGNVVLTKEGKYAFLIFDGEYCAYKYANDSEVYLGETKNTTCSIEDNEISITDLVVANGGENKPNQTPTAIIKENGDIIVALNNDSSTYNITKEGKITKNGTEIKDETNKNEAFKNVATAILSSPTATTVMLENQDLMDGIKTNDAAMEVMLDGFVNYFQAQDVSEIIKNSVNIINDNIDKLVGGTATVQEGTNLKKSTENYIETLNNVTSHSDIIVNNVEAIIENNTFTDTVFNLADATNSLLNNESAMNGLTSNQIAFTKIANNEKTMSKIVESQVARTAMYNNYAITEPILASSTVAINAMKKSSRYQVVSATTNSSYQCNSPANLTLYDGKAFVIGVSKSNSNGNYSLLHGNYINSNSSISQYGCVGTNGLVCGVNKFASTIKHNPIFYNINSCTWSGQSSYAAIFKI